MTASRKINANCPEQTLQVVKRLQSAGHAAVLAGGCVRDALLGRCPNDWDVATSALPEQVEALFPKTVAVGKQFGIIVVVLPDGTDCEVATFRGEGKYLDGRHPSQIHFVGMEEDVKRRDFTVNALLADPVCGEIYDFVGGVADLEKRLIRAVGDPFLRFEEDRLRVLRAIRFAATLDFQIHPETIEAIAPALPYLKQCISAERIAAETEKMLLCGNSRTAFHMMEQTGILETLFPELAVCRGVLQPPQFHPEGDVWQHQLKLLGEMDKVIRNCRSTENCPHDLRLDEKGVLQCASGEELRFLAWGALLHDIGKPSTFFRADDRIRFNGHDCVGAKMTQQVMTALKLPGALIDNAVYLVQNHMTLTSLPLTRIPARRRKLRDPRFPMLLELLRLDTAASFGDMTLHHQIVEMWHEEMAKPEPQPPPLKGQDLMNMGLKPSPLFKKLLQAAADQNLTMPFPDKDAAVKWLLENFPEIRK